MKQLSLLKNNKETIKVDDLWLKKIQIWHVFKYEYKGNKYRFLVINKKINSIKKETWYDDFISPWLSKFLYKKWNIILSNYIESKKIV